MDGMRMRSWGLSTRVALTFLVACSAIAVELLLQNVDISRCAADSNVHAACEAAHRDWGRAVATGLGVAVLFVPFMWRGSNHYHRRSDGPAVPPTSETTYARALRRGGVVAAVVAGAGLPVAAAGARVAPQMVAAATAIAALTMLLYAGSMRRRASAGSGTAER
jgi:hypothetical protein